MSCLLNTSFLSTPPLKASSLFLTLDGKGNYCAGSAWLFSKDRPIQLECIYRLPSFISLGYFYGNATAVLGFKPHRHEGKVTGLASRGEVVKDSPLLDIFYIDEAGLQVNPKYFLNLYSPFLLIQTAVILLLTSYISWQRSMVAQFRRDCSICS